MAAGFYRTIIMDYEHVRHAMNTHPEITPTMLGSMVDLLPSPPRGEQEERPAAGDYLLMTTRML